MAKRKTKKKKSSKRTKGGPGIFLGLLFIFIITLSVLVFVLKLPPNKHGVVKKNHIASFSKKGNQIEETGHQYEEPYQNILEEEIKKVDMALMQSVLISNLPKSSIEYVDVKKRYVGGNSYFFQSIQIKGTKEEIDLFKKHLFKFLKQWISKDKLTIKTSPDKIKIYVSSIPTHVISFPFREVREKEIGEGVGELVLIIDDIGRDIEAAKELIELFGNKITLSILPYSPHGREIDAMCRRRNIQVMLHMPMEPISYPEANPGEGALFTNMSDREIEMLTDKAISRLPYIVGVNNHMGSRFTQDKRVMRLFLNQLKKYHLFFVDSCTTPKTISKRLGSELNIPVFRRDIFIDNKRDVEDILIQLKKAEIYSLKKGLAVAIGHPYKETIKALAIWKKHKHTNVVLVPVTRLLEHRVVSLNNNQSLY